MLVRSTKIDKHRRYCPRIIRKHSSLIRTTCSPPERASATRCQHQSGGGGNRGSQVNRFEQVSSLGHQMSLGKDGAKGGSLYGTGRDLVQGEHLCEQTDTYENITFERSQKIPFQLTSTRVAI